jgi:hypothetical protein
MLKNLYRLGKVRLFSLPGILIVSVLILLDEARKQGYFFQLSDLFVPRMTHEKTLVALLMIGAFLQYKRVRARRRKRNEGLSQKV